MLDLLGVVPYMLDRLGVCMGVSSTMLGRIGDIPTMFDLIGVDLIPPPLLGCCMGVDDTMFDLNGVPCLDKYGEALPRL